MKYICTLLTVEDIDKSRYFYENTLGLKVTADFGENITFIGKFAIHKKSHFSEIIESEINFGHNNIELYFEVDDIEKISENLKNKNVKFLHDIKVMPWAQKVIRVYDPDNYIIEFGESMKNVAITLYNNGLKISHISEITLLSIDILENILKK